MEPTRPPYPQLPQWVETNKTIAQVLSIASTVLSGLTVLTFLTFQSKRGFPARLPVHMVIATFGLSLAVAIGSFSTDSFCPYMAIGIQFFGNAAVFWWAVISYNFYSVAVQDGDPHRKWLELPYFLIGWGLPFVTTIVAKASGALDVEPHIGDWECWMKDAGGDGNWYYFYGEMAFVCFIGLVLWPKVIQRLLRTHEWQPTEWVVVNYARHLVFCSLFFVVFCLMLAYRIVVAYKGGVQNVSKSLTIMHTACVTSTGVYTFFVFGLSRANVQLWRDLLCGADDIHDGSSIDSPLRNPSSPYYQVYVDSPQNHRSPQFISGQGSSYVGDSDDDSQYILSRQSVASSSRAFGSSVGR